jgi:hypothetical protein
MSSAASMKICANCQRKYSDSLEYCLADGTVLSPMDDPHATLRFESRPTQANAPAKRGVPMLVFALAAIVLAATIGLVAFVVLYLGSTNKAAVDSNRSNTTSASSTNAANSDPRSAMEQEIEKLQQIHSQLGVSMVQSDLAALDRVLADDYRYQNDIGWSLNKEQTLAFYRTKRVRYAYVTTPDPKVEMSKDLTSASVTGRAQTGGWLGRTRFDNSYLYRNKYEKRGDHWQLVSAEAKYH